MEDIATTDPFLQRLIAWGMAQPFVRAMLLTSTRAAPYARVDLFSDYDVLLLVEDVLALYDDRSWLEDLGHVLVLYRDPLEDRFGGPSFAYITQYEDRTKIDYLVFPAAAMEHIRALEALPDFLDVGYAVLLDKDHLAEGLRPPTYTAHIPAPPTDAAYQEVVEVFFHEATYVAKHLWRDDLLPAKYNLDYAMKAVELRRMLEWRLEIDADWAVKPGAYGKGLKQRTPPHLWQELEATYVGAGEDENWQALFDTLALFRRVAREVGAHLGYAYPDELHRRVGAYLRRVKRLDRAATAFS